MQVIPALDFCEWCGRANSLSIFSCWFFWMKQRHGISGSRDSPKSLDSVCERKQAVCLSVLDLLYLAGSFLLPFITTDDLDLSISASLALFSCLSIYYLLIYSETGSHSRLAWSSWSSCLIPGMLKLQFCVSFHTQPFLSFRCILN